MKSEDIKIEIVYQTLVRDGGPGVLQAAAIDPYRINKDGSDVIVRGNSLVFPNKNAIKKACVELITLVGSKVIDGFNYDESLLKITENRRGFVYTEKC